MDKWEAMPCPECGEPGLADGTALTLEFTEEEAQRLCELLMLVVYGYHGEAVADIAHEILDEAWPR